MVADSILVITVSEAEKYYYSTSILQGKTNMRVVTDNSFLLFYSQSLNISLDVTEKNFYIELKQIRVQRS